MIARAHRPCTFHSAAMPDADALRRARRAEGDTLRAEIDPPLVLPLSVVALAEEHDPSSCDCNNDVYGQGPCADCRRVFAAYRAARALTWFLDDLSVPDIDYAPRWRLFLAIPDDA